MPKSWINRLTASNKCRLALKIPSADWHLKFVVYSGRIVFRKGWCCQRDSNTRPHPYQGCALPLELWQRHHQRAWITRKLSGSEVFFHTVLTLWRVHRVIGRLLPRQRFKRRLFPRAWDRLDPDQEAHNAPCSVAEQLFSKEFSGSLFAGIAKGGIGRDDSGHLANFLSGADCQNPRQNHLTRIWGKNAHSED